MKKLILVLACYISLTSIVFAEDTACFGSNCNGVDTIRIDPRSTPTVAAIAFIDGSTQTTAGGGSLHGDNTNYVNLSGSTQTKTGSLIVTSATVNDMNVHGALTVRSLNTIFGSFYSNSSAASLVFDAASGGGIMSHRFQRGGNESFEYGHTPFNTERIFFTVGVSELEAFAIDSNTGYMGIGTTTSKPSSRLDVNNGSITVRGLSATIRTPTVQVSSNSSHETMQANTPCAPEPTTLPTFLAVDSVSRFGTSFDITLLSSGFLSKVFTFDVEPSINPFMPLLSVSTS